MIDSDAYLTELTWQMLVEGYLPPVNEVWVKVICLQVCVCPYGVLSQHALQVVSQHALQQVSGECYPSMHCRWYPSMPCSRSPGGRSPGPQPRGKRSGIWSRPTAKGKIEGDLVQSTAKGEVEGVWFGGVPALGEAWWRPPGQLLLWAVRILGMHSC